MDISPAAREVIIRTFTVSSFVVLESRMTSHRFEMGRQRSDAREGSRDIEHADDLLDTAPPANVDESSLPHLYPLFVFPPSLFPR